MVARFFVPGPYASGDRVELPADEAEHLTRVLRLRVDDRVRVFDGRGQEFEATVATVGKKSASVAVGAAREATPESRVAITVAAAVLKGDKMDDVVRDAVMIGAAAIQPIVTTRTEVTLSALARSRRTDRWNRVAVSSAKQCGRAVVPPVRDPIAFETLVHALRELTLPQPALLLVEPSAVMTTERLADLDATPPREATVVIGPEGGWTADEVEQGAAVCRLVTLGARTLRADAMATVAVAALFAVWREY